MEAVVVVMDIDMTDEDVALIGEEERCEVVEASVVVKILGAWGI